MLLLATEMHFKPVQGWVLAHIHKIVVRVIVPQMVMRHVTFAHLVGLVVHNVSLSILLPETNV